jgi:hypothetical protein
MAERRENSVLFSLKELRNIEDGRVQREKDEAAARVEADRAAKAAAERAMREAEERTRRDEEERVLSIQREQESRVREDQIRLQEAERRARVEGEVRLQEQRLHLDAQAKREQKSPLKAILGVTGVLVIVAGGLGYKMYGDHQAELATERAKLAEAQQAAQAAQAELQAKMAQIEKDMTAKLLAATTAEAKAKIRADAAAARAELQQSKSHHGSSAAKTDDKPAAPGYKKIEKQTINDNPLDGLFDDPNGKKKK